MRILIGLLFPSVLLCGCGKLDYYSPLPVPDLLRQPSPSSIAGDMPDTAALAKAYGRSLFPSKPDRVEISPAVFEAARNSYSVCVRASDPAQPVMYVSIWRNAFADRRRAVPSDGCANKTYAAVATD